MMNLIRYTLLALAFLLSSSLWAEDDKTAIEIQWHGLRPSSYQIIETEARLLAEQAKTICSPLVVQNPVLILHAPQNISDRVVGMAREERAFVVIDRTASVTQRREIMAHEIAHLFIDGGQPPSPENLLQEAFGQVVTLKVLYECNFMKSFRSLRGRMARSLMTSRKLPKDAFFVSYVYLPAALLAATCKTGFTPLLQAYRRNTKNLCGFLKEVQDEQLTQAIENRSISPQLLAGSLYGRFFAKTRE